MRVVHVDREHRDCGRPLPESDCYRSVGSIPSPSVRRVYAAIEGTLHGGSGGKKCRGSVRNFECEPVHHLGTMNIQSNLSAVNLCDS
jgi:hypothetical protein